MRQYFLYFSPVVSERVTRLSGGWGVRPQWSRVRAPAAALSSNNLGQVVHTHVPRSPSFFVLAFHNRLEYHHLNARVNSGYDAFTSLVNCGPVSRRWRCLFVYFWTCIGQKSAFPPSLFALRFGNALDYCNVDGCITRSSAIAEGLRDALVSTNPATTKHPILKWLQSTNKLEVCTPKVIVIAAFM